MALIKCKECSREISDKSKACIHCGCPLELEEKFNYDIEQTLLQTQKNYQVKDFILNKKVIISVVALVVIVLSIFAFIANSFSSDEDYGLRIVEKYQDMLKNPDSLVLRSDIAVISYSRNGDTYKYVFFDASGDNSYGASVTSTPCFVNGQYLCDSDEIPTTSEYMSMSDAEAKEYLGVELALAHWRLYGEDADEEDDDVINAYSVSAKKIAKKLKINCKVD